MDSYFLILCIFFCGQFDTYLILYSIYWANKSSIWEVFGGGGLNLFIVSEFFRMVPFFPVWFYFVNTFLIEPMEIQRFQVGHVLSSFAFASLSQELSLGRFGSLLGSWPNSRCSDLTPPFPVVQHLVSQSQHRCWHCPLSNWLFCLPNHSCSSSS